MEPKAVISGSPIEHGITLFLARVSNYIRYKELGVINYHLPTSTEVPLKFGNGFVISSHNLLDILLLIHAGIKVKPC